MELPQRPCTIVSRYQRFRGYLAALSYPPPASPLLSTQEPTCVVPTLFPWALPPTPYLVKSPRTVLRPYAPLTQTPFPFPLCSDPVPSPSWDVGHFLCLGPAFRPEYLPWRPCRLPGPTVPRPTSPLSRRLSPINLSTSEAPGAHPFYGQAPGTTCRVAFLHGPLACPLCDPEVPLPNPRLLVDPRASPIPDSSSVLRPRAHTQPLLPLPLF